MATSYETIVEDEGGVGKIARESHNSQARPRSALHKDEILNKLPKDVLHEYRQQN